METNDRNRLITPWGYIGYSLLFSIPVLGLIFILVFSFSKKYPCRRNYARAVLIGVIIALIVCVIMYFSGINYVELLQKNINNLPALTR